MRYHIDTIPIWDAFKNGADCCPLCALHGKTSESLVSLYLNEAVMEPDYRVEVNKKGFCGEHFLLLANGRNKLGLALQTQTRMEYIARELKKPNGPKVAAKEAAAVKELLSTCVICGQLHKTMALYRETAVRMYDGEPEFPALFAAAAICLPHYAGLLEFSRYAGKSAAGFLEALYNGMTSALNRLHAETGAFISKFDASKNKNAPAVFGEKEASALPRSINLLRGKIIK